MSRSSIKKEVDRNKCMSEETKAQFRTEGEPAFPEADKENKDSSSSPEGEENKGTDDSSSSEDQKDVNKGTEDTDKDGGFLNHPRWKEREEDWTKRFNDQEKRHQNDLTDIREEFGTARKDNEKQTQIPSWFGGDQNSWDAYRADRDVEIKAAEDRAVDRLKGEKTAEDKAIKDATDYMQSEITAIENDRTFNPDGTKVDPNKLLKFVLDNDLVDSKGKWNYRAGFKMMNAGKTETKEDNKDRKNMAGATTSESKAETKPAPFKTSADFKGSNRPW